ncbi:MFS transporter [Streptomyces naphthomycinicus]|uniref:MFS transporter n=1 Tax=Streptomyces naphthomycinicus TaxID=2872625 RepID=UPI001CED56B7|nr:MFS transporter [Streptomyces sp. TML10]
MASTQLSPPRTRASARSWAAVLTLAAATFAVVTSEMLPVGLLPSLARDLHVSAGTAGLTVTLPGLVAAAAAPLLPVVARRADRRTVLCALLLLLAAADLLTAYAPAFPVLLAARLLVGVCIGGVWAVAAGLGVRLLPGPSAGRATAVVFSGIAVASVLGVPAGTLLGSVAGWRWAFAAMAGCAFAVAGTLAAVLPPLPAERPVRLGAFPGLLRRPPVRRALAAVALLVTGHFTAYTYVRPVLQRAPGTGATLVSALLLGYGLAGVAGNFVGGALAARDPRRALRLLAAVLGGVVLLLVPASGSPVLAGVLLMAWGLAYGGVSVTSQNGLSAAAPHAPEAASALFAGVFNTAIALGALTGGRLADGPGPTAVLAVGAALALLAALVTGRRE